MIRETILKNSFLPSYLQRGITILQMEMFNYFYQIIHNFVSQKGGFLPLKLHVGLQNCKLGFFITFEIKKKYITNCHYSWENK